ncbi:MAG: succinylglutamate-semialdehyde dehydrogenase [Thermodesulfobacteriota bacterium]
MENKVHFVGNEWRGGIGPPFSSTDPATGRVIWEGRAATEDEVHEAVCIARDAFPSWDALGLEARIRHLEAFGKELEAERDRLAEAICVDTGKPRWESLTEVDSMIGKIGVSIEAYQDRCRVKVEEMPAARGITRFRPHGVIGVFGPFNFPGHLPNGHIVPALLAGNTIVFKPSRQAPLVAMKTLELWERTGILPGVINMVQGGRQTGVALSRHPDLNGLFFTGSAEVGRALHQAFGGQPEKILALEMGGNNPLIVHEVADLKAAAYLTVISAFITAGQRCSCARRLIVPVGQNGDRFIEQLVELMGHVRVGIWTDDPEPFMGPVISDQVATDLLAVQSRFAKSGGVSLVEMRSLRGIKALLSPGLMDVSRVPDRPDEEYFGPFLQLIRVSDFDEALREANNTRYGLAAGLLSDNEELYGEFYRKIRAGVVNWNRQTVGASSKLPFGGIGWSGNHRPSAYLAADYCSYPVASIEADSVAAPATPLPGIEL